MAMLPLLASAESGDETSVAGVVSRAATSGEQTVKAVQFALQIDGIAAPVADVDAMFEGACEMGYEPACDAEAWRNEKGRYELASISKALSDRCDSDDDGVGCYVLGLQASADAKGSSEEFSLQLAAYAFQRACDLGIEDACGLHGLQAAFGVGMQAVPRAAHRFLDRKCDADVGSACAALGRVYEEHPAYTSKVDEAPELFEKACDLGSITGCLSLFDIDSDPDVQQTLCERGHIDSCVAIAEAEGDPAIALEQWTIACEDGGSGPTCLKVAEYHLALSEVDQAGEFFDKACDAGEDRGCAGSTALVIRDLVPADAAFESQLRKVCPSDGDPLLDEAGGPFHAYTESCASLGLLIMGNGDKVGALDHFEKACPGSSLANLKACHPLGRAYETGEGRDRDRQTAVTYFGLACEAGNLVSCLRRADLLEAGRGTLRDEVAALSGYKRACQEGDLLEACIKAGDLLLEGRMVARDALTALVFYETVCAEGLAEGCVRIGKVYQLDEVMRDPVKARVAYLRSIEEGSAEGLRRYGEMLYWGEGGRARPGHGRGYYRRACRDGDNVACLGPRPELRGRK